MFSINSTFFILVRFGIKWVPDVFKDLLQIACDSLIRLSSFFKYGSYYLNVWQPIHH